jgi:hypothetical protein
VADRGTVVDEALASAFRVEAFDVPSAHLELERGGHAVGRLQSIGLSRVRMLMQIDEARGHNQPACIDHGPAGHRRCRHDANGAADDAHMADGIKSRVGIDHATVGDDHIE